MQKAGRSIKKNPPTIPAFIRNIQHRGSMPHINSIVDIYNVETLTETISCHFLNLYIHKDNQV